MIEHDMQANGLSETGEGGHLSEEHACNHDHDHEHDHRCSYDHAHDHDCGHKHGVTTHTNLALPRATIELESHDHEQATAVSANITVHNGCRIAFESIVLAMQDIAWEVERAGGIVGHLKASAREGKITAHASVTAPNLPPEGEYDSGAMLSHESWIQAAAIALLIDREVLERIATSAFSDNL